MIRSPGLVAGGLAAGALSAPALGSALARPRRRQAPQREQVGLLRARPGGVEESSTSEVAHLAAQRIPAAARRSARPHVTVPGPLRPQLAAPPFGTAPTDALDALDSEPAGRRIRIDAPAQAGTRGATREIEAALYRLQDALRGLQHHDGKKELAQAPVRAGARERAVAAPCAGRGGGVRGVGRPGP